MDRGESFPPACRSRVDAFPLQFHSKQPDRVPKLVGTPQEMRDIMQVLKAKATSMAPSIEDGITVQDLTYTAADGAQIPLRIYTPSGRSEAIPALV